MIILRENLLDGATLSGGAWSSGLPLNNVKDPRVSNKARSTNLAEASTQFVANLGGSKAVRGLALFGTNLDQSAKYRIRGYSDSGLTIETFDTGEQAVGDERAPWCTTEELGGLDWTHPNCWTGFLPFEDYDNAGFALIVVFPADRIASYLKVDLVNTVNSDGYIEIGRAYAGPAFIPSMNFSPDGNSFSAIPNTTFQTTLGGNRYFNRQRANRQIKVLFPFLGADEVWSEVYRMRAMCDLDKQVVVIPDESASVSDLQKQAILGTFEELPSWQLFNVDLASTGFVVTESL